MLVYTLSSALQRPCVIGKTQTFNKLSGARSSSQVADPEHQDEVLSQDREC